MFAHLSSCTVFFTVASQAYELATHGRLTYNAFLESVLAKDGTLLKDLGLKIQNPLTDELFGTAYYDLTDFEVKHGTQIHLNLLMAGCPKRSIRSPSLDGSYVAQ